MGREAKIAIGVLLLVVTGLILYPSKEETYSAVSPTVLAAVFGVPGLLLLAAGLVPPRSRRVTMVFIPARLFGGLALSLGGIGVLFVFYQVLHIAPTIVRVGALIAVPVGVLVAASCWSDNGK